MKRLWIKTERILKRINGTINFVRKYNHSIIANHFRTNQHGDRIHKLQSNGTFILLSGYDLSFNKWKIHNRELKMSKTRDASVDNLSENNEWHDQLSQSQVHGQMRNLSNLWRCSIKPLQEFSICVSQQTGNSYNSSTHLQIHNITSWKTNRRYQLNHMTAFKQK